LESQVLSPDPDKMFAEFCTEFAGLTFQDIYFRNTGYKKVHMEEIFKTKYEYCHIDADKIVITKTHKITDLLVDYTESINDFFKTLLVFFIAIPLFTSLSVVFYYMGNYGISIFFGVFGLFFLLIVFYLLLFTSGTPVIYKEKIVKVKLRKILLFNVIEIKYRDFDRIKSRGIILTNDQFDIDMALEILSTDELIADKIEYSGKHIDLYS